MSTGRGKGNRENNRRRPVAGLGPGRGAQATGNDLVILTVFL